MSSRRLEADREDLMREATALRERAEFRIPNEAESVIAGYRTDGALSIYFGPDPCFHFDPQGRLRRAFVAGDLFRTQGETLARLRRSRTAEAVELQRHDLPLQERDEFLAAARDRLRAFAEALASNHADCLEQISGGPALPEKLARDLKNIVAAPLELAPRIAGKK